MPESAKRRRLFSVDDGGESAVDRISDLPDSLLLHILSFLGADEVVKTSLLSKRWKNLWALVTTMDFDVILNRKRSPHNFVAYVNSYLMLHEGQRIQKFRAHLVYRKMQHVYIDSWFPFLKRRGVEEIDLGFLYSWPLHRVKNEHERCVICDSMFDCKVLKVLSLNGCNLDPAACFRFKLLKNLKLTGVNFSKLDLSCCPLLEFLTLRNCNQSCILDIHAPSSKFRSLLLTDSSEAWDAKLVLYAPHVLFIELCGCLRQQYDIGDLSYIIKASICVEKFRDEKGGDELHRLIGIMKTFAHAQTFILSNSSIKALAYATMENPNIQFLNVVALEVDTYLNHLGIWILIHVLPIFPHVEFLIFNIRMKWCTTGPLFAETSVEAKLTWKSLEQLLIPVAGGIKNIRINDFLWDKILEKVHRGRYRNPISSIIELSKFVDNEKLEPVKLLLGCCGMLKVMDIKITNDSYIRNPILKSDFCLFLNNKLQGLPRASTNARICVSC